MIYIEELHRNLARSTSGCDRVQKWVVLPVCCTRPVGGFSQKVTIFGFLMSLAGGGFLSPPWLGGREGGFTQYVADATHRCLRWALLSARVS